MPGAAMMALVGVVVAFVLVTVFHGLIKSISNERSDHRTVWREFGLSIAFALLFLTSWIAQGITQWQTFTDESRAHGESPEVGDFVSEFAASTLENWQSEFLQLFSFVALAALYIHRGSAESKDGEDNIQASLRRVEEQLGTLPKSAPSEAGKQWQLPETPLEMEDEQHRRSANARRRARTSASTRRRTQPKKSPPTT